MHRRNLTPRSYWERRVEERGLLFHTADDGSAYWNEKACYVFSAAEIDTLEKVTSELNDLCLNAVDAVVVNDLWDSFQIAEPFRDFIRQSWDHDEITVYGRFDLLYDGTTPPKLLEYNADTPTGLLEAAVTQWFWLQDVRPNADQFNSIHERLIEVWRRLRAEGRDNFAFAAVDGHLEDFMTVTYLRDTAMQAGLDTQHLPMDRLGWHQGFKMFVDLDDRPLKDVFKLYPWELMFAEEFGQQLPAARTRWLEAPWKAILSNKAILPLLYELFPGHPNLLPAAWQPLAGPQVCKPIHGREGANVSILVGGEVKAQTGGEYGEGPFIYQAYQAAPRCDGNTAIIGSWMVNGHACGIGIREDEGLITTNTSRFVPHYFE